jgi:hypothetical protein
VRMPSLKTRYVAHTLDDLFCYLTNLRLSNPQHPQCNHTGISYKKKQGVELLRGTRSSDFQEKAIWQTTPVQLNLPRKSSVGSPGV